MSAVIVLEGCQHHGGNLLGRLIGMKGSPRIGRAHQPVILFGCQQHELALAAPRDLHRPSKSGLDDLAGTVAEVGQRKIGHRTLLPETVLAIIAITGILARLQSGSRRVDTVAALSKRPVTPRPPNE